MASEGPEGGGRRPLKPWEPWLPILGVGALAGLAVVAAAVSDAARAWLLHWLWEPIVLDLGYNPVNTTALVLLAVALLAWLALMFLYHGEAVTLQAGLSGLFFYFWAVVLRVLEDADLFAPFADDLRAQGADPAAACLPDPHSFADCAGVLFITPLLPIWISLAMYAVARIGLQVQWVGQRKGQAAAQRRARIWLAVLAAVAAVPGIVRPAWLAAFPHPAAGLVAALAAGVVLSRLRRLHWSHMLFAGAGIALAMSGSLVLTWFAGGTAQWGPDGPLRPWLIPWCAVAVVAVVLLHRRAARMLAQGPRKPPAAPAGLAPWLLLYLDLALATLACAALVVITLAYEGSGRGLAALALAGIMLLVPLAAKRMQRQGDSRLAFAAGGIALLMLAGQLADALVTAIGLDVLGAGEKHVVPRTLIAAVQALGLPEPLGSYPAAIVLIGIKVPLVALATWVVGVRAAVWWPRGDALRLLVLLAVGIIGASPALRNVLRMAMGV